MQTYLAYYMTHDDLLPWDDPSTQYPQKEIIYCGTDKIMALVAIRTEGLVSATIETWENGKQVASVNYWRTNDHYSVIDDPNF